MFTGLVAGVGALRRREDLAVGQRFWIAHPFGPLELGESVAVQGACLTVVTNEDGLFSTDLSPETLARTTLGELAVDAPLNLERALLATDRLGGHLVSGHVDGVGTIALVEPFGDMTRVEVQVGAELARYVAEKGSLTVDGVSLTVNAVEGERAALFLIPHTRQVTTLGTLHEGKRVNLEVDLLARYVERLLEFRGV